MILKFKKKQTQYAYSVQNWLIGNEKYEHFDFETKPSNTLESAIIYSTHFNRNIKRQHSEEALHYLDIKVDQRTFEVILFYLGFKDEQFFHQQQLTNAPGPAIET